MTYKELENAKVGTVIRRQSDNNCFTYLGDCCWVHCGQIVKTQATGQFNRKDKFEKILTGGE